MKSFPMIPDFVTELEELTIAVVCSLNGEELARKDRGRLYQLLCEVRRFNLYGREGTCPAALYHGPGHQSRCGCDLGIEHTGPHRGHAVGEDVFWKGLVSFTGYFDEWPDLEEDS